MYPLSLVLQQTIFVTQVWCGGTFAIFFNLRASEISSTISYSVVLVSQARTGYTNNETLKLCLLCLLKTGLAGVVFTMGKTMWFLHGNNWLKVLMGIWEIGKSWV